MINNFMNCCTMKNQLEGFLKKNNLEKILEALDSGFIKNGIFNAKMPITHVEIEEIKAFCEQKIN